MCFYRFFKSLLSINGYVPIKAIRIEIVTVLLCGSVFLPSNVIAERLTFEIEIKNHLFIPDKIVVPADTKIRLILYNRDASSEEFESYPLNREKLISGHNKATIFIGPLSVGEYPFFGEFNHKTAQGLIIAK